MSEVDFNTILGRLLRDGALRDSLCAQPTQTLVRLGATETQRSILLKLNPTDLEFQARVLLRKRFMSVLPLLPLTCARLEDRAWPEFYNYARVEWPSGPQAALEDACNFCQRLLVKRNVTVSRCEYNRLRFKLSQKLIAVHLRTDIAIHKKNRLGLQLLFRRPGSALREFAFYLAF